MGKIFLGLGAFLSASVGGLATKVLASLGIGLITGGALLAAVNSLTSSLQSNMNSISGLAAAFIDVSGINYGISLIVSALVYRATMKALPRIGAIPK